MKKNYNSSVLIIALLGIAILLLGILAGNIIKSPSQNNFSISPNIIVRDSTDLKKLDLINNNSYLRTFEESIEKTIYKEFDRTINYLNFTIALFAIFLTITLVAFGFFTLRKMSETRELLDKIIAAPDAVMKKYHSNQLNDLLPKLLSSDNREKSDAIHNIYSNTQLDEEKHFDILANAIEREYQNTNSYTYLNVLNLFDSLSRLNYSKAIMKGFEIFEKFHNDNTMQIIVPRVMESKDKLHKDKFLELLCEKDNPKKVNDLINNIDHFKNFDRDMIIYLSKNAPLQIFLRILNSIDQKNKSFDFRSLISDLDSKVFVNNYFQHYCNLLRQKDLLDKDALRQIILKTLENDEDNLSQFTNIISVIINSTIPDDDKLSVINELQKKYNSKFDIKQVFERFEEEKNPKYLALKSHLES